MVRQNEFPQRLFFRRLPLAYLQETISRYKKATFALFSQAGGEKI
jgi:hypothetical protein